MFKLRVPERIINHCKNQVALYNFGQRSFANGSQDQQLTGIIGQCVLMELFGWPLIDGATGCDGGFDIVFKSLRIDVKTMGRTTDVRPYYVNNFLAVQFGFDNDLYIFCSLNKNKNELTVCGWLPKDKFTEKAKYYPKGTIRTRSDGTTFPTFADLYEIVNADLYDVDSFEDMVNSIQDYYRVL